MPGLRRGRRVPQPGQADSCNYTINYLGLLLPFLRNWDYNCSGLVDVFQRRKTNYLIAITFRDYLLGKPSTQYSSPGSGELGHVDDDGDELLEDVDGGGGGGGVGEEQEQEGGGDGGQGGGEHGGQVGQGRGAQQERLQGGGRGDQVWKNRN